MTAANIRPKISPTPSETVERIIQEHAALRQKVHGIHSVLAEHDPNPAEIETLLCEFRNALVIHFANEEEEDGFFAEVSSLRATAGR